MPTMTLRRAVLGTIAAVTIGAGVVGETASAADTPTCVTGTEFRQATRGMTKGQVDRIFDIHGRERGRSLLNVRFVYRHCQPGLLVNMYYNPSTMRLKSKILSTIPVAPSNPPAPKPAPGDDTPGCVTAYEMGQIVPFVTDIWTVHNKFGTAGTLKSVNKYIYIRQYRPCVPPSWGPEALVEVSYSVSSNHVETIGWT